MHGKADHWSLNETSKEIEEPFSPAEERRSNAGSPDKLRPEPGPKRRPLPVREKREGNVDGLETEPDRRSSIAPYFLLCAALLIVYSALALIHRAEPRLLEPFLKSIPWVGPSIVKNSHLRKGIVLESIRPGFQSIQGNREVLVLSGVALNRTPVKVREVRIEGHIFGSDGKQIERQTITVGNAISATILRDLTAQEIATLQKLSPPKRFEIGPDESASFVIVFLKPNAGIKSFGYRVVSVEEP